MLRRIPRIVLPLLLLLAGCAKHAARFATFNASLNREKAGQLLTDLATPNDPQIRNVAEIIQRANPDVLLINEFDYDHAGRGVYLFAKNYLAIGQNGAKPIHFRYRFTAPVNTGVASGFDLDNDGKIVTTPGTRAYGGDALGFGLFPGQYGMVLLSKYPIDTTAVRTFQRLKWKDIPGAMLPVDPKTNKPWYTDEELNVFRLSSKSHWDVPVKLAGKTVHVMASHPTPPSFDGPEDRNGKRNHDEIRLWADYLSGGAEADYIVDDANNRGRRDADLSFVLMGDMNADPIDGQSVAGAIDQLLHHPRATTRPTPTSDGAAEAATRDGGANANQKGDPHNDTADFADAGNGPGNLRCDYVLPSRDLKVVDAKVFWPTAKDPLSRLVKMPPATTQPASSDHRLVYIDVKW